MDNPVSEGIRSLLTTHVGVSGYTLNTGIIPESPDDVIVVSDSGGLPSNPKWLLDFPSAQIIVRDAVGKYLAAFAEINTVKDILLGITSLALLGDRYVSITMGSDVAFIGSDDNQRPMFSLNLRFITEPNTSPETNRLPL